MALNVPAKPPGSRSPLSPEVAVHGGAAELPTRSRAPLRQAVASVGDLMVLKAGAASPPAGDAPSPPCPEL